MNDTTLFHNTLLSDDGLRFNGGDNNNIDPIVVNHVDNKETAEKLKNEHTIGNINKTIPEPLPVVAEREVRPIEGEVVVEETEEEKKELDAILIPFKKYPKLKKWVELFTDKNNKKTYGNRTESAMQAYDCQSRADAASIGAQNYRKLHGLATIFAENKGVTVDRLLSVGLARALTSENPAWFSMMAELLNLKEPKGASIVINNSQQNNTLIQVSDADQKNFNQQFKDFIKAT